jgi:hypothetical protein
MRNIAIHKLCHVREDSAQIPFARVFSVNDESGATTLNLICKCLGKKAAIHTGDTMPTFPTVNLTIQYPLVSADAAFISGALCTAQRNCTGFIA